MTYGPLLNGATVLVFEGVTAKSFVFDVLLTLTLFWGLF